MLNITQGMTISSLNRMDQQTFDQYDKNGDGVISYNEYANFISVAGVGQTNQVNKKQPDKYSQKFNFEQFEPTGPINFESNGGYNSKRLNILA